MGADRIVVGFSDFGWGIQRNEYKALVRAPVRDQPIGRVMGGAASAWRRLGASVGDSGMGVGLFVRAPDAEAA